MHKIFVSAALASTAMIFCAPQAMSTVLTVDSGWQDDTLDAIGDPTENSPWTFTVATSAILSVTDSFVPGDTYFLSGDVTGTTTFFAGSAGDVQASGFYGPSWTDVSYSKIALTVGPGTYTFSITGDGAGGVPAGLGVRLDTASVPEPASWALMLGGFGAIGGAMRSRRKTAVSFG